MVKISLWLYYIRLCKTQKYLQMFDSLHNQWRRLTAFRTSVASMEIYPGIENLILPMLSYPGCHIRAVLWLYVPHAYGRQEWRHCYVKVTSSYQYTGTSRSPLCPQRNFGRHIVIALFVHPSVSPSVRQSVCSSRLVSGAYILYSWGRNSKFGEWMHLGMAECRVPFSGHFDLDLDLCPSF